MNVTEHSQMYLSLWEEHGGAPGLARFAADPESGALQLLDQPDSQNSFGCSFVDRRRNILYVCNEVAQVRGIPYETGRIFGYRISPEDGSLTELFRKETFCPNPAYVSQSPDGRFLLVAHHSVTGAISRLEKTEDGSYALKQINREAPLVVFALDEAGVPGEIVDVQKHPIDPDSRPYGTYMHCCVFSPDGRFVAVCDKGDGRIYLYRFHPETGTFSLCSSTVTDVRGMHPRYCVFHPTLPYLVVNHEKEHGHRMMVTSFRYFEDGTLEKLSSVNLLADEDVVPERAHYEQQGLAISEDGSYVYTCVNGPNFIGVLSLDGQGTLRLVQRAAVDGQWPRGLALMPGGRHLVVTCLVSGDVITYPVQEGLLGAPVKQAAIRGGAYLSFR